MIKRVVSDHSRARRTSKRGHFLTDLGRRSLQLVLPIVWTEAQRRGFSSRRRDDGHRTATARLARLGPPKGLLRRAATPISPCSIPRRDSTVDDSIDRAPAQSHPVSREQLQGVVRECGLRGPAHPRKRDRGGGYHDPLWTTAISSDLAPKRDGRSVLYANARFFARRRTRQTGQGVLEGARVTDRGKWMDGWESRRKRTPGHALRHTSVGRAGRD